MTSAFLSAGERSIAVIGDHPLGGAWPVAAPYPRHGDTALIELALRHLFLADRQGVRHMDCSAVPLPFGRDCVGDVVERTSVAQEQAQAMLASELVFTAQRIATRPGLARG